MRLVDQDTDDANHANSKRVSWLGLVIGNSRLHWAAFSEVGHLATWHTSHLQAQHVDGLIQDNFCADRWPGLDTPLPYDLSVDLSVPESPKLWIATVVPAQGMLWQGYQSAVFVDSARLPLANGYDTLGIDRSLALIGAMAYYGQPILVIDGGTAITLSAGAEQQFTGGAILPGLRLQFKSLAQGTATLPDILPDKIDWPDHLPERWATSTTTAMQSGILHNLVSGLLVSILRWQQQYPDGQVVITGGDGQPLCRWLMQSQPSLEPILNIDPNLIFRGLYAYRQHVLNTP